MARTKKTSPTIVVAITPDRYERAIRAASGACLIADAIKDQGYTGVSVDMATIRFTDREAGERYTYLTPGPAQHVLLAFDQGWPNPADQVTIKKAVKVEAVTTRKSEVKKREARLAELEAKTEAGEPLTAKEEAVLAKLRKPSRPTKRGKATVDENGTVIGGTPIVQGPPHPNLLRSRNRHFGAKISNPGMVFEAAVEEAVNKRLQTELT
jgi:hypothetical protein